MSSSEEENEPKKIANVPVSDLKKALTKFYLKRDDWSKLSIRDICSYMEKKFDLKSGRLTKNKTFEHLIEEVVDQNGHIKRKRIEQNNTSSKKRKENSDHHKKSKPTSSSASTSSSESSEPKKKRRKRYVKRVKDIDDPQVRKIDRLKKNLRACGVPITGFHRDESNSRALHKLQEMIKQYEDYGLKEGRMSDTEIIKARTAITAKREVDELKLIPRKLQIPHKDQNDRRRPVRRVARKKVSYDVPFPKTGVEEVDKESSVSDSKYETSNYSGSD